MPAGAVGLPRDSMVNVTALVTVKKDELTGAVGHVPAALMRTVDSGYGWFSGSEPSLTRANVAPEIVVSVLPWVNP